MKRERWLDIPGYKGKYQASNLGRVRSLDFWDGRRNVTGRTLKPGKMKSGHLQVSLGRRNTKLVHKLVMLAFVGPCPDGKEILHKNGIPDDNEWPRNLKYGTRSENSRQDWDTGVRKPNLAWVYSKNGKRMKDWKEYEAMHAGY